MPTFLADDGGKVNSMNPITDRIKNWLHEYIYIPLLGERIYQKEYRNQTLMVRNTAYYNCTFYHCSFIGEGVVLRKCVFYYEGNIFEIGKLNHSTIAYCKLIPNTERRSQ